MPTTAIGIIQSCRARASSQRICTSATSDRGRLAWPCATQAAHRRHRAFLEQLIVRRELAVNFVTFNDGYDRFSGCERWGRQTLSAHRRDRRPHLYTEEELDAGGTHDPLWNAASGRW